jgi:5-methylcytosine-specific restriction protein B
MTINYRDYEKAVFDWLNSKHQEDSHFTFSVRRKAVKGAERDYFIGTENSGYFSTTFWNIPVTYPGASTDLISLIFYLTDEGYRYSFLFYQTRNPKGEQNKLDLALIQHLRMEIEREFGPVRGNKGDTKMERFTYPYDLPTFQDLSELFKDLDKILEKMIQLVDNGISKLKKKDPNFIAHRFRPDEFNEAIEKMELRMGAHTRSEPEKKGKSVLVSTPTNSNTGISPISEPLNQILYGPPGTGKTYHTINKALEILGEEVNGQTREEIKNKFEQYVQQGRIIFTTFHQSMSYEDFIEGIKPQVSDKEDSEVSYRVEEGIFMRICIEAAFALAKVNDHESTKTVLDFSFSYDQLIDQLTEALTQEDRITLPTKSGGKIEVDSISANGNIILKHPGKKRKYTVSKNRLTRLNNTFEELADVHNIDKQFREIIGGSNSSAYWSVLNALRSNGHSKNLDIPEERLYSWEEKKEVVETLYEHPLNKDHAAPYVLIIDEINRGNIAQIFGELITLIEPDKRWGNKESLRVVLPYSKMPFAVPANLFIIGTMNTADRSVEALDTALRRRFDFIEMLPTPELLAPKRLIWNLLWDYPEGNWYDEPFATKFSDLLNLLGAESKLEEDIEDLWDNKMADQGQQEDQLVLFQNYEYSLNLQELLETINQRIEILIDRDHQIGHSYFMTVGSFTALKEAFHNRIIPLLQEYFFGDYGKIGLVLGSGFVEKVERNGAAVFASFDHEAADELAERPIYRLRNVTEITDAEFLEALEYLKS